MFGKFFASTFTGSMFGAGTDVFAVWGYVIAHAVNSTVELNPPLLAAILGTTPTRISAAIEQLCRPDPDSRNPDQAGRRLVKEGQFQYRVTSHRFYRAVRNEEDRRAYNREKQRQFRARKRASSVTSMSQPVSNVKLPLSAHTEAEAEAEAEAEILVVPPVNKVKQEQAQKYLSSADADFEQFRQAYPVSRRIGGKAGKQAFKTAMMDQNGTHLAVMLEAVEQQKRSEQWQNPKLIPLMTTWLNQERWTQVLPEITQQIDRRTPFEKARDAGLIKRR